jgi:hypothetical protein
MPFMSSFTSRLLAVLGVLILVILVIVHVEGVNEHLLQTILDQTVVSLRESGLIQRGGVLTTLINSSQQARP